MNSSTQTSPKNKTTIITTTAHRTFKLGLDVSAAVLELAGSERK